MGALGPGARSSPVGVFSYHATPRQMGRGSVGDRVVVVVVRGSMTEAERLDLVREVKGVAEKLNEKLSEFAFEFFRADVLEGVTGEERRGYSLTQYYSALAPWRKEWHCSYIIAISSEVLES